MPNAPTFSPGPLLRLPLKEDLVGAFKGKKLSDLRTPAAIVDRTVFIANSERVARETKARGMGFRVHVKTHKTLEGMRIQCEAAGGVPKVICSTLAEVHYLVDGGLVEEGLINDILYSMPIGQDKIQDVASLQDRIGDKGIIRLMIDHPAQVEALQRYNESSGRTMKWAVFVKVDGGGRRAGVPATSDQMKELILSIAASSAVDIFGFYSHFGHSYASDSLDAATEYYRGEIECANSAAKLARQLGAKGEWVLSVGATPTTHAATSGETKQDGLEGALELHAGCYCMCDLQQYATSLVPQENLALSVLTSVVSLYPHRNEAMCDTGAIAVSKDTGPLPGYGNVISPAHATGWKLGKVSQEHGVLMHREGEEAGELKVGDKLRIVPQHACLVCAGQPWLYVVEEGGDEVVDVWVPCKGW